MTGSSPIGAFDSLYASLRSVDLGIVVEVVVGEARGLPPRVGGCDVSGMQGPRV